MNERSSLSIVMVGEVDHGKSSVVGRILVDTGTIPSSKIEQVKSICEQQGKEFEYAFLLDAFEEEQRQGITIDVSRIQFNANGVTYKLIDAPGHREFLKNMISGSSAADAAILLIDAKEGAREQSRRHSYLLKLIGISQVIVVINKMDLVGYSQATYDSICREHSAYLKKLGLVATHYVPVSAKQGQCIIESSKEMKWYKGPALIPSMNDLKPRLNSDGAPLRFAVQDVYKFDERRVIAGRVESGSIRSGDSVRIWPAGRAVRVAMVDRWSDQTYEKRGFKGQAITGDSVGLVLEEQAFIERGNVISLEERAPTLSTMFDASIFWMGKSPLAVSSQVRVKLLTQEIEAQVAQIHRIIDTSTLGDGGKDSKKVERHEVAEITLHLSRPMVADAFNEVQESGRFVLMADGQVAGGGIISRPLSAYRQISRPASTDIAWEFSKVTAAERATKNGHRGATIWLTGLSGAGKSTIAKLLESFLFKRGCQVYVLDGDNVRHGLNADLDFSAKSRSENIRRVGEVAKLFSDAGILVITAFISPFREDRDRVRKIMNKGMFFEMYVKCPIEVCEQRDPKGLYKRARAGVLKEFTGVSSPFEEPPSPDLVLETHEVTPAECVDSIVRHLEQIGIFYKL